MKKTLMIKFISFLLIALLCLPMLASCKARPLAATRLATTEVGKVGEYSVLYEEFYLLANNFVKANKNSDKYKNNPDALRADALEAVKRDITVNYAALTLCKQFGLEYDEKELQKQVEETIEAQINSSFDGDRSAYFESQISAGITDHYSRFVTGVDALVSQLPKKYIEQKTDGMPANDEEAVEHIMNSFAHTWHIVIFVNSEEEREAKRAKAEEALAAVLSGDKRTAIMDNLSKYSEYHLIENEISGEDAYGFYFPKGYMNEAYEEAAFGLDVLEISGIVEGKAADDYGVTKDCYFIIQRLENKEEEVKSNLPMLKEIISDAITHRRVTEIQKTLSFEMNDFGKSLDVLNLEAPKNGVDYQLIIWIASAAAAVAVVAAGIIIFRKIRLKRFHKSLKKGK